jgi:hypothetical protein
MSPHDSDRRDSSLRKLALANRWLLAGSVALTGVLTEVAAQVLPGRAKATSSAPSHAATRPKSAKRGTSGSRTAGSAKQLTAPSEAPAATSESSSSSDEPSSASSSATSEESSAPVVSGGS